MESATEKANEPIRIESLCRNTFMTVSATHDSRSAQTSKSVSVDCEYRQMSQTTDWTIGLQIEIFDSLTKERV